MPVGVPRVPFQFGDEEGDAYWVDIYNRLYRQRALFLGQMIDGELGNQTVGLLTYLNLEDPTRDIDLFINCPGGALLPGVGIYDMIQVIKPDVQTICIGVAASMGCFILQGGTITKRIALPHARIMMHQPLVNLDVRKKSGDTIMEMSEVIKIYHSIVEIYAQRTGKPSEIIYGDMVRDTYMSPEEAQAHGIIDHIGIPEPEEEDYYN